MTSSPLPENEILSKYTVPCAACGKRLILPHKTHALYDAIREVKDWTTRDALSRDKVREGATVSTSRLEPDKGVRELYVCPGRHERVASETCRVQALRKHAVCPMCGEETEWKWPLPCDKCTTHAEAAYHREAINKARGEKESVFVQTIVDGLSPSAFHERRLRDVMRDLFDAFGIEEPSGSGTTETIGWRTDRWNDPEGVRALLDDKQIATVSELFRWLNVATADALSEAHKRGSQLLTALIGGQMTFDALNDKVTEQIRRYQETSDKIRKEEKEA